MGMNQVIGLPGPHTERAFAYRRVRTTPNGAMYVPGGVTIDGTKSRDPGNTSYEYVLRSGLIMGRITASKKFAPSILGVTLNAEAANSTSIEVSAATATELARRIGTSGTFALVGPPTAAGTVASTQVTYSAVNTTSGVITCTALSAAKIAGSFVCPEDGSETPIGLIDDGSGIRVTDMDGVSQDVGFPHLLIGGMVTTAGIINYPSDTSLIAWLKGYLNTSSGSNFAFQESYSG